MTLLSKLVQIISFQGFTAFLALLGDFNSFFKWGKNLGLKFGGGGKNSGPVNLIHPCLRGAFQKENVPNCGNSP